MFAYQAGLQSNIEEEPKRSELKAAGDAAAHELLDRFYPLFKKYLHVIKSGQINFVNPEQRRFISLFMDDIKYRWALCSRKRLMPAQKHEVSERFNFVKDTYGRNDPGEILTDLRVCFLYMASRYQDTGKSFCCYVFNAFRYEAFRMIQKFTRNPINVYYKTKEFEDCVQMPHPDYPTSKIVEDIGINQFGFPDYSWYRGDTCSDLFSALTPLDRKVLEQYYLEKMSDRQIAEQFGVDRKMIKIVRVDAVRKIEALTGRRVPEELMKKQNSGRCRIQFHKDKK